MLADDAGNILCNLQGPMDKGTAFEDILLSHAAASGDGSIPSVFIGDSVGDLAALLAAAVPIVFGCNATLRRALATFGCNLHPVSEIEMGSTTKPPGHLYTTTTWHEIHSALFKSAAQKSSPTKGAAVVGGDLAQEQVDGSSTFKVGAAASVHDDQPCLEGSNTNKAERPVPMGILLPSTKALAAARAEVSIGPSGQAAELEWRGRAGREGFVQQQSCISTASSPRVLVIAGSDSGGGAGIQADIKTCLACGAFASTAVTALTAQNSYGVHAVHIPPAETLRAQLDAVVDDLGSDVAIKTGMLPDRAAVDAVADMVCRLQETMHASLVVDPVLVSTSGHSLAESDVCQALQERLLPLASVVTPNLSEASALLGEHLLDPSLHYSLYNGHQQVHCSKHE
jgi:hypothetical protein